jgi:anti-sigma-K factor RskA
MNDHARHQDDIGAYLLGAMDEDERRDFELHLTGCSACRKHVEALRPAAEVLPGSVEQLEPPPGLKAAIMAEVERDARARDGGRARTTRRVPRLRFLRPALVAATLLVGLAIGFGVAQLGGDEDVRRVAATVDRAMPAAGGTLQIADDSATLQLHDMPDLGDTRVYQVWLQHGDEMVPARTFEVGAGGAGEVELPDVDDADGVYVTREDRGGARVPSEEPIVSVPL